MDIAEILEKIFSILMIILIISAIALITLGCLLIALRLKLMMSGI